MTEGALHEDSRDEGVICPICKQPTVAADVCFRCGWINFSGARFQSVSQPPAGLAFDPKSNSFRLKKGWWKTKWSRYGIFLMLVFLWIAGEQLYNGFIETGGVNPWWTAGAAAFLYLLAALLLNRTEITMSANALEVKRGPLVVPLMGSFSLSRSEIKRLDIARQEVSGRGGRSVSFPIKALTQTGREYSVMDSEDENESYRLYAFLQKTLATAQKVERVTPEAAEVFFAAPAWKVSRIYTMTLFALLVLNVPCVLLIKTWRFDAGFWAAYGLITAAAFIVMFFHHRRHLSIWDSKPLRPGERPAGALAYLIATPLLTLLLIPLIMGLYLVMRRMGGP